MKIKWTIFAMEDREAIFDYIEADSPRAAAMVDDRIETQIESLIHTPEMGRIGRVAETRELVISRTPYVVAYRIDAGTVRILRILHGAQQWPDQITG